jgi:hypothetical protein
MKEIQDMFYTFLWGLKLPHIESFCKALKMSWLYKLLDPMNMSRWQILLLSYIEKYDGDNIFNKKDTIITIFVNNKKNTISFNITIKPNRLTQDVNNVVFLFAT